MKGLIAALALAACALAACSDDAEDPGQNQPDSGPPPPMTGFDPCTDSARLGRFAVQIGASKSSVTGQVFSGALPPAVPQVVKSIKDCELLRAPDLSCSPPCAAGKVCGFSSTCEAAPAALDVGTVTVTGLKATVSMTAQAPKYLYADDGKLPHPGVAPGTAVSLKSTGGAFKALSLRGRGIEQLNVPSQNLELKKEVALSVTWDAPVQQEQAARIQLELHLDSQGKRPTWVRCIRRDTGSTTIPAMMINDLLAAAKSGSPILKISRRTADSANVIAGCVELLMVSEVEMVVKVP